jgi:very-short-patch-repair endonuclease
MEKVLIGVIKNKRDLKILLKEKWYRIPLKYAPKREYDVLAFYQPASFRTEGKRIEYYGIVRSKRIVKRKTLIDDGIRSTEKYYKITFSRIVKLKAPIINKNKMRVSFKFTNFEKLYESKNIGDLFDISDIEGKIESVLKDMGIEYKREFVVKTKNGKGYRLDFALFTGNKKIDIECDGEKWHSLKAQRIIDKKRDAELKKTGWTILRLKEKEIVNNIDLCIKKIRLKINV